MKTKRLYCFNTQLGGEHGSPLVQESLSWAALTMPSLSEYGRLALVAASAAVWCTGPSAIRRGLLALSAQLECEAVAGTAPSGVGSPARVSTVWILHTPQDQYHLAHVAYKIPAVAWSPLPSLNPEQEPGTELAFRLLFPVHADEAVAMLETNFWRKQ